MPKFSDRSRELLSGCDTRLQDICCRAIEVMDFTIITGYRNKQDQDKALAEGKSKLKWPDGKHNKYPSLAVDICPYRNGLQWNDKEAFILLAGIILGIATTKDIKIRWGGDWTQDFNLHNDSFLDLGHFELVEA